jgi:hypothetical protein
MVLGSIRETAGALTLKIASGGVKRAELNFLLSARGLIRL